MFIYRFNQNNSYGIFYKPEIHTHPDLPNRIWSKGDDVYVLAENAEQANILAEKHTNVYLDGQGDCPCCGNRWYPFGLWSEDNEEDGWHIFDPTYMSDSKLNQYAVPADVREIYAPETE